MPKIRHIALASLDPAKTAAFFVEGFGFRELQRFGDFSGNTPGKSYGMYLTDGTLSLAIIRFGWSQAGKPLDFTGIHHFGIEVEDVDAHSAKLAALGADFFAQPAHKDPNAFYETKFVGPDGILMDIADKPWIGSVPAEQHANDVPFGAD